VKRDYKNTNKAQLKHYCDKHSIPYTSRSSKQTLWNLVKEHEQRAKILSFPSLKSGAKGRTKEDLEAWLFEVIYGDALFQTQTSTGETIDLPAKISDRLQAVRTLVQMKRWDQPEPATPTNPEEIKQQLKEALEAM
jgi:hypothetical protein